MISKHEIRENVTRHIGELLKGPIEGENEIVLGHMRLRYMLGVLFGKGVTQSALASENENLGDDAEPDDEDTGSKDFTPERDNPLSLANEDLPSSVGVSFLISKGASIKINCSAAQYVEGNKREWKRYPLKEKPITIKAENTKKRSLFGEKAELACTWRKVEGKHLVTVSLRNLQEGITIKPKSGKKIDWSMNLYQVTMSCTVVNGRLLPYGVKDPSKISIEEQIQELQFLEAPPYAVGHGASCNWNLKEKTVSIDYIPEEFVYRPTYDNLIIGSGNKEVPFENQDVFRLSFLSDDNNYPGMVPTALRDLCDFYEGWIGSFEDADLPGYEGARGKLKERANHALDRMRSSIDLIESDGIAKTSFQLANKAMLRQMLQGELSETKRRDRENRNEPWPIPYDEENNPDSTGIPQDKFKWRPFQLAFILLVMSSLEDDDATGTQDLVDLIWFTTGGGKTEAYLLVAAYEMIRRRLAWGEKGFGTSIITRYTYRFLTADQFNRTAKLICALDILRRENASLGVEPFSLGLWVGDGVTPNHLNSSSTKTLCALEMYRQMIQSSEPRKDSARFQITECPHCSTALIPATSAPKDAFGIHVIQIC